VRVASSATIIDGESTSGAAAKGASSPRYESRYPPRYEVASASSSLSSSISSSSSSDSDDQGDSSHSSHHSAHSSISPLPDFASAKSYHSVVDLTNAPFPSKSDLSLSPGIRTVRSAPSLPSMATPRPKIKPSRAPLRRICLPYLPEHTRRRYLPGFASIVSHERFRDWASSFRRLDPRYQILEYLNDVATFGAARIETEGVGRSAHLLGPILRAFKRSGVFSVWRPTSNDAIRKMMTGEGTGKGLDIKGKSAKKGVLSGFVPFVQIHDKEGHKRAIRSLPKEARIRVFYGTKEGRDEAAERLRTVSDEMVRAIEEDKPVVANKLAKPSDRAKAIRRLERWEMTDPSITFLDEYASQDRYGVEIPERLFWEAFVMRESIVRDGSPFETGRDSEPDFQDMNFVSTRHGGNKSAMVKGEPRPVVWQQPDPENGYENPMNPLSLLVAYEENERVLPVVSDFDCFLIGTRGVSYDEPLAKDQVDQLGWCLDGIESILDGMGGPDGIHAWTTRWFSLLKEKGGKKKAAVPQYGFGDSKSYSIVENAVERLKNNGAVRHGAECFNYYFPQELDDEFLVVSDDLDGKIPWTYMNRDQLRAFLLRKIDDGYTFPLNPKWVLCDEGWKEVYDKLLASDRPNVTESIDAWLPPGSGLRERIAGVCERHPKGFRRRSKAKNHVDFAAWIAGGSGDLASQLDDLSKLLPPSPKTAPRGIAHAPSRVMRSLALLRKTKMIAGLERQGTEGTAAMDLAELELDQDDQDVQDLQIEDVSKLLRQSMSPTTLSLQGSEGESAGVRRKPMRSPALLRKSRLIETLRTSRIIETLDRQSTEGTAAMDLADLELDRDEVLERAKRKAKAIFVWKMAAQEAAKKNQHKKAASSGDETR